MLFVGLFLIWLNGSDGGRLYQVTQKVGVLRVRQTKRDNLLYNKAEYTIANGCTLLYRELFMKSTAKSTFEKIILIKKIPSSLYWISVSIIGFTSFILLLLYFKEDLYILEKLIASYTIAIIPISNIWLSHYFARTMEEFSENIWGKDSKLESWIREREQRIFYLQSTLSRLIVIVVVISGLISIHLIGLPFQSKLVRILAMPAFAIVLWFCGQTLYISFDLLVTLKDIVNKPVKAPFMLIPNPAVSKLQTLYSTAALIIVFLYISLLVAFWKGPYGFHPIWLSWLSILAFYPTFFLISSFVQLHFLLQKIKLSYLKTINSEIQKVLPQILKPNSNNDLDRLDKLIKIQNEIQTIKEWPIPLGSSFALVITSLLGVVQTIVSIREFLTP